MGNLVLNLSGVNENAGGFEALPKGKYEMMVDDVTFGTSKKGSPMMTWKFKMDSEEYGKRSFYFYNVLDQAFGIAALKKTIVALGMDVDFDEFDPEAFADAGDAIGLPILVELGIQKYEGEKRNTVKTVFASNDANPFM